MELQPMGSPITSIPTMRGMLETELRGLLLLDLVLENADVFVLRNFDSEHIIFFVTENKAVEQEIRGHHLCSEM
jgi:hypothetical protein